MVIAFGNVSSPQIRHPSLAGIHGKRMVAHLATGNVPWRKAARPSVPSPILSYFCSVKHLSATAVRLMSAVETAALDWSRSRKNRFDRQPRRRFPPALEELLFVPPVVVWLDLLLLLLDRARGLGSFREPHPSGGQVNHESPVFRTHHLARAREVAPCVSAVLFRVHQTSPSISFPAIHK
jgi:hypothetical protein